MKTRGETPYIILLVVELQTPLVEGQGLVTRHFQLNSARRRGFSPEVFIMVSYFPSSRECATNLRVRASSARSDFSEARARARFP